MYKKIRREDEAGVVSQHGTVGAETHSKKTGELKILRVWENRLI